MGRPPLVKLAPAHSARLLLLGLAVLALVAFLVMLSPEWLTGDDPLGVVEGSIGWHSAPPPADIPLETFLPGQKRDLSPAQALAENLASPITPHNPAPPPFRASWLSAPELTRASDCMASAIYYEAAGESDAGQIAVAQVILNRLRHPRFPKDVCGVVYQGSDRASGCQFTFSCDGALARKPDPAGMARARRIADLALHGLISPIAGQATHYHAISIVPVWAHEMHKVAIIGHHVFYRPPADYGPYPALGAAVVAISAPAGAAQPSTLQAPVDGTLSIAKGAVVGRAGLAGRATAPEAPAPQPAPAPANDRPRSYFAKPQRHAGALALPSPP